MNRQYNLQQLTARRSRLQRYRQKLNDRLENVFAFRLIVGVAFFALLVGVALNLFVSVLFAIEVGLLALFLIAVRYSRRLKWHVGQAEFLEGFFGRMIRRLDFQSEDVTLAVENERWIHHPLSQDLDLVGSASLLNILDETVHSSGQKYLIESLVEAKFSKEIVQNRQKQISFLAERSGVLRKFLRFSSQKYKDETHTLPELLNTTFVFPQFRSVHKKLWLLCGVFWSALVIEAFIGLNTRWEIFWLIYFFYMVYSLRKIEKTFSRLQDIVLRFNVLVPGFKIIETFSRTHQLKDNLKEFQNSPTQAIKRFEAGFSYLSVQTHPVFLFAINSLLPWNYFFVWRAEKERQGLAHRIDKVFFEFAWFDSLASLGLFRRYLTDVFPSFGEVLSFKNALHPLIAAKKNIANSFEWPNQKNLCLVTGSNMAGKSTFLRMVGINFVLARMGAPVFADSFTIPLVPLKTCIRVSDSVREGFSYFYAETLRVGEILKQAKNQKILFLIDEVFKGTNNRERYIGGKTLILEMASSHSMGFVTTHDLELTKLESPKVANFHFRDEIKDNEMYFSYKIESGPCPTTNALKIMSMAGIPVDF